MEIIINNTIISNAVLLINDNLNLLIFVDEVMSFFKAYVKKSLLNIFDIKLHFQLPFGTTKIHICVIFYKCMSNSLLSCPVDTRRRDVG